MKCTIYYIRISFKRLRGIYFPRTDTEQFTKISQKSMNQRRKFNMNYEWTVVFDFSRYSLQSILQNKVMLSGTKHIRQWLVGTSGTESMDSQSRYPSFNTPYIYRRKLVKVVPVSVH